VHQERTQKLANRILTCCCLVLLSCSADAQDRDTQTEWVFVSHPLRWDSPPRELHLKQKEASADLVVLYPTGQFAGISCYLIKGSNGKIAISRGEGDVVRIGEWQLEGADVLAKSRVVFRTVTIEGRPIPEAEISERFRKKTPSRLRGSPFEYRKLKGFSDLAYLDTLIRCDRRAWDGHAERKDFVPPCMAPQ
jgi:hypothetical protein